MYWIRSEYGILKMITSSLSRDRRHSLIGIVWYLVLGVAIGLCSSFPASAQDGNESTETGTDQVNSAKSTRLDYAEVSFISNNLRDPFLNPLLKKKETANEDQEIDRGLPPAGISGTYIEEATLQGVSIREDNERLAIVKGSGKRVYFIREGDRLFDGYLKAINRDSITFVRERKMRSGKILTQEVIKRLRTP